MNTKSLWKYTTPKQLELIEELRRDRPYKLPKHYPSWDSLSGLIGILAGTEGAGNETILHNRKLWGHWINSAAPLYCISKNMLQALEQTTLEGVGKIIFNDDWMPCLSCFTVVFPDSCFKPDPERSQMFIKSVCMDFGNWQDDQDWFGFSAITSDDCTTGSRILKVKSEEYRISKSGNPVVDNVAAMIFNCALILEALPQAGEESIALSRKKSKRHQAGDRDLLLPRWIGKDYVRPQIPKPHQGGSHNSPITHWRSGHWRQQVCGAGRGDRKPLWIQPALINGPKSE